MTGAGTGTGTGTGVGSTEPNSTGSTEPNSTGSTEPNSTRSTEPANTADLYDEIQEIRARYPEDVESATLPALRRAQEEHGWLSPDVLREVADALDTTPAYCKAVASFYDQFHLEPIGEHLVEVCTNVSCAVVGAQQVVEAFESGLGCRAGETTEDGKVTLRAVE